jgi:hypothetical protein
MTITFEESQRLIKSILGKMHGLNKCRINFMLHMLSLYLTVKGRINFLQMQRYGTYREATYRNNFKKEFDFETFNRINIEQHSSPERVVVFDPSYISKSGKHTYGVGKFYSGCAQRPEWGLEIGELAIVDVVNQTALHYYWEQTPNKLTLQAKKQTFIDHYASLLTSRMDKLTQLASHLVVDGYFAKKTFFGKVLVGQNHLPLITKLRNDAALYYLYQGPPTGKPGRPKFYDGKVDWKQLDPCHWTQHQAKEDTQVFSAKIYSKSLQRKLKVVCVQTLKADGSFKVDKVYACTDLSLTAEKIVHYYQLRFQAEFPFRDAKQYVGLNHCQARDKEKLDFHFNASLTAVSMAKTAHWLALPKEERNAFSVADVKTLYFNQLMLDKFLSIFQIDPEIAKNNAHIQQFLAFGSIAA